MIAEGTVRLKVFGAMSEEDIGPTSHDRLPSIEVGTFLVR
jgi:hypothetical protein